VSTPRLHRRQVLKAALAAASAPRVRFRGVPSPSRSQLAYAHKGGIWVAPADGSDRRKLTDSGRDAYPAWSRNSSQIAFLRRLEQKDAFDYIGQLHVVSRDGGGERRLLDAPCSRPRWSPTGDELAVVALTGAEKLELMFLDPTGKPTRPSINVRRRVQPPPWGWMAVSDWHPEGKLMSFCIWGHLLRQGLIAEPAGDHLKAAYDLSYLPQLEEDEVSAFAWRPGNAQAAAVEAPGALKLQRLGTERYTRTLWLSQPDGARIRALYSSKVLDFYTVAWHPDGRSITFESGGMLMRVDVESGALSRLWPGQHPAWSPT
jgi:hypothetical protein